MTDLSLEDRLREELNAAQACLPSTKAIENLLGRSETSEELMELREALEGVREALTAMSALLNHPCAQGDGGRGYALKP